jgi:hypothetical protein
MEPLHNSNTPFPRRRPELPAFCRTRRRSVTERNGDLGSLRNLLLAVLLFQLSTLLLVIAGGPQPIGSQPLVPSRSVESKDQP